MSKVIKLNRLKKSLALPKDASMDDIEAYIVNSNKAFKKIKKSLRGDKDVSQTSLAILKYILTASIDLYPKAQAAMKKFNGPDNTYAMIALGNQIREVLAELRALSDKSELPTRILSEIIDVTLAELVQSVQSNNNLMRRMLHQSVKDVKDRKLLKKQMDNAYLSLVEVVRTKRGVMANQLLNIFSA